MTPSGYLRRLGLAIPVESTVDPQAVRELVKINAGPGQVLGNLINEWQAGRSDFKSEIELDQIRRQLLAVQKRLREKIEEL